GRPAGTAGSPPVGSPAEGGGAGGAPYPATLVEFHHANGYAWAHPDSVVALGRRCHRRLHLRPAEPVGSPPPLGRAPHPAAWRRRWAGPGSWSSPPTRRPRGPRRGRSAPAGFRATSPRDLSPGAPRKRKGAWFAFGSLQDGPERQMGTAVPICLGKPSLEL